jgi:hypothetical protein
MVERHVALSSISVTPVTGRGGPYGCETSRLPHFLESGLTDDGEVVSVGECEVLSPSKGIR